jgi:hypothetical protein
LPRLDLDFCPDRLKRPLKIDEQCSNSSALLAIATHRCPTLVQVHVGSLDVAVLLRNLEMDFEHAPDARLLAFYRGIREQVAAGEALGNRHRLTGGGVKQYAQGPEAEMRHRGLNFAPIIWPGR